jgi:hypothetical protein
MTAPSRQELITLRARRALYHCTIADNARRILRELKARGHDVGMVMARHVVVPLPSMLRVSAQQCRAGACAIDPVGADNQKTWRRLMLQAETLEGWAGQSAGRRVAMPGTDVGPRVHSRLNEKRHPVGKTGWRLLNCR